ncbi:MAG: enoyl-CoA hydratase/isomerase family protein [Candidatus Marinimicrobia bacterium]|nr:enoyl-CoA hydratase/isomerase family protein [Candidatus Neomarinimicrobiota bacterium]MBL7023248.1 enoyl-CoA hydratase/isomerase family protein [Candidatus Neomarinimicrobiota bacterium]MBL7108842.1 enoyl-CoA hydratase/isomerase family protein [Candidatus Neomarinimicrobiota bacterium]
MNNGITLTNTSDIFTLWMNISKSNAINNCFLDEFTSCLRNIPSESPLIIAGNGQFFSSGLDLIFCESLNVDQFEIFIRNFQNLLLSLIKRNGPVISIINGHTVAGGFLLSCSTDFRFGDLGNYKLGMNEKQLGISLPPVPQAILFDIFGDHIDAILDVDEFYSPKTISQLNYFCKISNQPMTDAIECINTISKDNVFLENKKKRYESISEFLNKNHEPMMQQFLDAWWSDEASQKRNEVLIKIGHNKIKT